MFLRDDQDLSVIEKACQEAEAQPAPIAHRSKFVESRLVSSFRALNQNGAYSVSCWFRFSTSDHLEDMLNQANFAFLVLTGEDELPTGKLNPRLNVVHEDAFRSATSFSRLLTV